MWLCLLHNYFLSTFLLSCLYINVEMTWSSKPANFWILFYVTHAPIGEILDICSPCQFFIHMYEHNQAYSPSWWIFMKILFMLYYVFRLIFIFAVIPLQMMFRFLKRHLRQSRKNTCPSQSKASWGSHANQSQSSSLSSQY